MSREISSILNDTDVRVDLPAEKVMNWLKEK